jgi:1-deoxy-D-xylulose-5-phosphate reductoisomerase
MQAEQSKGIAIFGSTGSVGQHTLDVIDRNRDRFHVIALGVNKSIDSLLEQVNRFQPKYVIISDSKAALTFQKNLNSSVCKPELLVGVESLDQVACLDEVDCVMAAIVGGAGLSSTLSAARAGKTVLLANKESLVMAGELLTKIAKQNQATLLPIDSEHNAVFQCMQNIASSEVKSGISQVTLTASGGPFLHTPNDQLAAITPDQACAHPNWSMGRKISVDSATMMNKGLEVIEACLLFDMDINKINVVIHPQSIIHAMVAYKDGSTLAHMGYPDMRVPIAHALGWPIRLSSGVDILDITKYSGLEFFMPDLKKFPCLNLAMQAQKMGGTGPVLLNAANEIAVEAFLASKIKFLDIVSVVKHVLDDIEPVSLDCVELVRQVDQQARSHATQCLAHLNN